MPKGNATGGKRYKKGKKNRFNSNENITKLPYSNNEQTYASIKKKLGGARVEVECLDGKIKHAIIPGKFRKKKRVLMEIGDVVLCNIPAITSDTTLYIVYKYNNREANQLKNEGIINFDVTIDEDTIKFTNEPSENLNTTCECNRCYSCLGSIDSDSMSSSESEDEKCNDDVVDIDKL